MKLTKLSLVVLTFMAAPAMAQWQPAIFATSIQSQGNMTSGGVINANKGISVNGGPLTVYGQSVNLTGGTTLNVGGLATLNGGLNMTGNVIDGVKADWSKGNSAVNVNQLTAVRDNLNTTIANNATTAANATALVQTNLNTEAQARIDGDAATLNAANVYTDNRVTQQSGSDRAYTDTQVGKEATTRAAEVTRVDNRVTKVETKTQNITATTGVTRIQGDAFIDGNISAGSGIVDRGARRGEGIYEGKAIANGNDLMSIRQEAMKYAGQVGANTLSQANNYTDQRIGEVRRETNQVGAMAMAASIVGNVSPAPGKNFALTAGMGSYGGQAALAVGFTHRVAQNVQWTASVSTVSGGRTGVGAGVSWSF